MAAIATSTRPEETRATRSSASQRASGFGAALRALRAAPESAKVRPEQLAILETEYRSACYEADALFEHAPWCSSPGDKPAAHNCVSGDAPYIDGMHGLLAGDPVPTVSACAWAREEDGLQSVSIHLLSDGDADGGEGWFSADAARALAAQLNAAADLIDGGAA